MAKYFTEKELKLIEQYQNTESQREINKIYRQLRPTMITMVQSIYHRYPNYYSEFKTKEEDYLHLEMFAVKLLDKVDITKGVAQTFGYLTRCIYHEHNHNSKRAQKKLTHYLEDQLDDPIAQDNTRPDDTEYFINIEWKCLVDAIAQDEILQFEDPQMFQWLQTNIVIPYQSGNMKKIITILTNYLKRDTPFAHELKLYLKTL